MFISFKSHPKLEKIYKKITEILSPYSYCLIENSEPIAKQIFPSVSFPFVTAWASTALSDHPSYLIENFKIPEGTLISHQRLYRPCQHDGKLHFNADDYLYFIEKTGNVVRCHRYDNLRQDHYIPISEFSSTEQIFEVYSLPKNKNGPITQFFSNGAILPDMPKFYELGNGDI